MTIIYSFRGGDARHGSGINFGGQGSGGGDTGHDSDNGNSGDTNAVEITVYYFVRRLAIELWYSGTCFFCCVRPMCID